MKKNIKISGMAEPCSVFPGVRSSKDERHIRKSVLSILGIAVAIIISVLFHTDAYPQSPLSIGSKLPDNIIVKNVITPLSQHKGDSTSLLLKKEKVVPIHRDRMRSGEVELNLSSFRGKLLIIDFWATWCAPCIAMLPKTDSLQKVFQKEVQFIPVTYEPREKVEKLLSKSKKLSSITLPMATNEQTLHALFPHKELPHYVWINGEGTVIAITGAQEVTADNIRAMLASNRPTLNEKKDVMISYNREDPLVFANLGITKDQLHFESLLSGYIEGLPGRYDLIPATEGGVKRITAINLTLESLYRLAWSNGTQYIGRNRAVYEVNDPLPIITTERDKQKLKEWMREYARCYELIVPDEWSTKIFQHMQQDLEKYYPQYKVSMEKRGRPCLALVRTSSEDKIKTNGQPSHFSFSHLEATMTNCSLDLLTAQLNAIYLQNLTTPVVNNTGYTANVDLFLDANLTNVESLRTALKPYGLDLIPKDQEIEVLVIRDSN
jgi:thiol-disulfide isomerase/thioredoxin